MKRQVTRIAAYGLVTDQGKILLCRISDQVPSSVGEWTLPGGGIDFGEDPQAAAVREVFEETGLHVTVDELVTVDAIKLDFGDSEMHALRIIYRVSIVDGELANEVDGSTDLCAWLTPDEARRLPLVGLARTGLDLAFPA